MNKIDARRYGIIVRFADFDGEYCYEAKIQELPSIAEYADTFEEAYNLAIDSIESLAEVYSEQGKIFPKPLVGSEV